MNHWNNGPTRYMIDPSKKTVENTCCLGFADDARVFGTAVSYSYLSDGAMWVGNGEYESRVNYCPNCGREAEKKVGEDD